MSADLERRLREIERAGAPPRWVTAGIVFAVSSLTASFIIAWFQVTA